MMGGEAAVAARVGAGEMIVESRVVEREGAGRVEVEVRMGAGELTIAGGATALLEADFATNVPAWRPEIAYAVRDGRGRLTLRQPDGADGYVVRNARQRWALRFADDVPLTLRICVGTLTGTIAPGGLALTGLAIEVGTGTLTLDLGGTRGPLDAAITGGVVSAALRLPAAVGARVAVRAPVAIVNAVGLARRGDVYLHEPRGGAEAALRVAITGGVATVDLTTDERVRSAGGA